MSYTVSTSAPIAATDTTNGTSRGGPTGPSDSLLTASGTTTPDSTRITMSSVVYGVGNAHSIRQNVTVNDADTAHRACTALRYTSAPNQRHTSR